MPPSAPPLPRSPTQTRSTVVVAGGAVAAAACAIGGSYLWAFIGVFFVWHGWRLRTQGVAALRTHAALQAISRGELDLAEAHLDAIGSWATRRGTVMRSVVFQRALIAFYRGEIAAAIDLAEAATSSRTGLVMRDFELVQRSMLLSLRALAKASSGTDDDGAADVADVVASPHALPEALSRARLAEAVVLARRGALEELGAHVSAHGSLILESALPRERVLFRALRKMIHSRARHVYREAAKPSTPEPEGALGSWVARIAPAAAGFTESTTFAEAARENHLPLPTAEAKAAVAKARAAARPWRKRALPVMYVVLISALLVAAVFAAVLFLPATSTWAPETIPGVDPSMFIAVAVSLVLSGAIFAFGIVRGRRQSRDLLAARRAVAAGEMVVASPLLDRLTESKLGLAGGHAWWLRAVDAERHARFDDCVTLCDRALAAINAQSAALRSLAAFELTPAVLGLRALGLAARGRENEAIAELGTVAKNHGAFAHRAVAELRVGLMAAVRRGDLDEARRIALGRTPELAISFRDEVLADLVLALSATASVEEQERVDSELRGNATVRAWIDDVAPALRDALARRVAGQGYRIAAPATERVEDAGLEAASDTAASMSTVR